MGITFGPDAAKRIAKAVRRVENDPRSLAGERVRYTPKETEFWAMITGSDITGLRLSWIKVIIDPSNDEPDFAIENGLAFKLVTEDVQPGEPFTAREVSGNRQIPNYVVVRMIFNGYDANDEPVFLFSYPAPPADIGVPPHDHRDTFNGGFAFGTFHPGTDLPQMPFAI